MLKQKLSNLSDRELLKMVYIDLADYEKEAIDFAQEELRKRNIDNTTELLRSLKNPSLIDHFNCPKSNKIDKTVIDWKIFFLFIILCPLWTLFAVNLSSLSEFTKVSYSSGTTVLQTDEAKLKSVLTLGISPYSKKAIIDTSKKNIRIEMRYFFRNNKELNIAFKDIMYVEYDEWDSGGMEHNIRTPYATIKLIMLNGKDIELTTTNFTKSQYKLAETIADAIRKPLKFREKN